MKHYTKTVEQSLSQTKTQKTGLSSQEAKDRLAQNGPNLLPQKKPTPMIIRFLKQFCDIMIIILFVAAAISITIAIVENTPSEMIDGFIILAIVLANAILGFVQEVKAEKEMKALLSMSEPETKVIRDGEIVKVHSSEVVVGDIIVLEAGDIVPADLRLVESANLKCDESSLTGESLAVSKDHDFIGDEKTPLAERKNMVYKGSVVTIGRGEGVVVATGKDTELGKIATMLNETEKSDTPLQKNIKLVGKIITVIVLIVAALTFGLELIFKPNGSIIEAFLTAVAIAVAAIPESLPAVITVIMSMGVAKLSKKKAIIKRLHAVETLGSTQIICSDKTGTLTQNVMTVRKVYFNGQIQEAQKYENKEFEILTKTMALCNDSTYSKKGYVGDPTETALTEYAHKCGYVKKELEQNNVRIGEIPFDSIRKLMSTVNNCNGALTQYTKGAPDLILQNCTKILIDGEIKELTAELREQVMLANTQMGDQALRVLGFATKDINFVQEIETEDIKEQDLVFVGLVGMMDPPRKEVFDAVKKCKKAHMMPVMITGDHRGTAFAVAKEIGICDDESQVMSGVELDALSDEEYKKIINNIRVYARVSPENKVRIVKTFKELGRVVAMTGDGVNDAPSLKTADIGVGMGITGTDVTKEVADMIVTDDNFATIVVAVEEGRRIYSNILKTIGFLFAANMGEILSLFIATLLFPSLTFLLPVQILFVNLITDSLPAIALGLEPPEKDLMAQAPRKSNSTVFSNGVGVQIVTMGVFQTIAVLLAFFIGYTLTGNDLIATSMAFYTLNLVQMSYLLSMRVNGSAFISNPFKNKWILYSIILCIAILCIVAFTPVGAVFGLVDIGLIDWLIVIGLSAMVFFASEILKYVLRKKQNK
ncbi:MAG: cation-translocating P-type ATPase [Clostridia bacterium]|nr:cation-translocating P-type ATPase [Clostridia bacterium]